MFPEKLSSDASGTPTSQRQRNLASRQVGTSPPQFGYDGGMEESEETRPNRRATRLIVTVLVVVFVLYPLSIGPMGVLCYSIGAMGFFVVIYWPLEAICKATGIELTSIELLAMISLIGLSILVGTRQLPK